METKILLIDDNLDVLEALEFLLKLHGYSVVKAASVKEALFIASNQHIHAAIQDMNFELGITSGEEGKQLFFELKKIVPYLPIILITAWTTLETAIELVKAGAVDYFSKPWDDNKLLTSLQDALVDSGASTKGANQPYIYLSPAMQSLTALAKRVASSDLSILISGPNGSGKERLADFVKQHSERASGPYIKVNMGALPSELIEAELFGVRKGAFTGADKDRVGRFEAADGGTLFLDEIGNLPLSGQMKLLRALQSGEFEAVGSSQTIKVNVRVISATNADLQAAIAENLFREDLFYRLNGIELAIPPLKERPEDILPIARHYIGEKLKLSSKAAALLKTYSWPGNIRELENVCKRAVVMADSIYIQEEDLGLMSQKPPLEKPSENKHIATVLKNTHWNIARAAKELDMSRQALYRRIEKYKLTREDD